MYIHCLGHLSLCPPPSSPFCPTLHVTPSFPSSENIKDNKKDIVFLLVWDKDSYTERFLVLLPCTCVLEPTLFNLYQTSSLLLGHLLIVASVSLRFARLQWAHQSHSSFRFPSLSLFLPCTFFLYCVTHVQ
jgi:hypothetical protein